MPRFFFPFCAAVLVGLIGTAQAKPLSRIIAEMGLSPADFQVLDAASKTLLSGGTPAVGAQQSWDNPETGSKGTVRVQEVRGNCVQLQHSVQPGGADAPRQIRTRRCRDAGGNWLLTP